MSSSTRSDIDRMSYPNLSFISFSGIILSSTPYYLLTDPTFFLRMPREENLDALPVYCPVIFESVASHNHIPLLV